MSVEDHRRRVRRAVATGAAAALLITGATVAKGVDFRIRRPDVAKVLELKGDVSGVDIETKVTEWANKVQTLSNNDNRAVGIRDMAGGDKQITVNTHTSRDGKEYALIYTIDANKKVKSLIATKTEKGDDYKQDYYQLYREGNGTEWNVLHITFNDSASGPNVPDQEHGSTYATQNNSRLTRSQFHNNWSIPVDSIVETIVTAK